MKKNIFTSAAGASLDRTKEHISSLKGEQKELIGAMNKGEKNPIIPTRLRQILKDLKDLDAMKKKQKKLLDEAKKYKA